ncbi:autophagy-related protein 13 homolog [Chrysoperla carnea]|uniref:autophagy-related protein 13 homolog n=1 Tax=Chrysoperla carnea TaxID=189513 RepID=UPI001D067166|nr:autophagy-related protein 13 homolog [Chrysoperla carnea]
MASLKITVQDKKELDKFTKFLALKAAQIIVQSRLGEKIQTQGKPYTSGADWFNLAIKDLPDVLAEAKQAISSELGTTRLPLCVEISLRTAEGDTMVLETWCLSSLHEQYDPGTRATYTVYNRMGILLKSLVSVTRVTPAYKLSRRQSPDSYVICYRIYMGEPQFHNLGDGYKQVRVGQICTPIGTLHLSVAYRTKMTISPTQTGSNNSIMLKSDHFKTETDDKNTKNDDDNYVVIMNKPLKRGAFIEPECVNFPPISPKPFEKLFEKYNNGKQSVEIQTPKPITKPLSINISKKKESSLEELRPLKVPFAQSDKDDIAKVTNLYWYFKEAPTLESFENGPTIGEQDLLGEIEKHQKQLQTYNTLVKELLRSSKGDDDTDPENEIEKKKSKSKKDKANKKQQQSSTINKENIESNNSCTPSSTNLITNKIILNDSNENSSGDNILPAPPQKVNNDNPKSEDDNNNN